MNYSDINNKWKSFLAENTFKEDKVVSKKKKKKKDGKEIIVSEKQNCMDEGSGCMEEGDLEEFGTDLQSEEQLEEMSGMSGIGGGDVQGFAGPTFGKPKKRH